MKDLLRTINHTLERIEAKLDSCKCNCNCSTTKAVIAPKMPLAEIPVSTNTNLSNCTNKGL